MTESYKNSYLQAQQKSYIVSDLVAPGTWNDKVHVPNKNKRTIVRKVDLYMQAFKSLAVAKETTAKLPREIAMGIFSIIASTAKTTLRIFNKKDHSLVRPQALPQDKAILT